MQITIDPFTFFALAALIAAFAKLVWAFRRDPKGGEERRSLLSRESRPDRTLPAE